MRRFYLFVQFSQRCELPHHKYIVRVPQFVCLTKSHTVILDKLPSANYEREKELISQICSGQNLYVVASVPDTVHVAFQLQFGP